MKKDIEGYVASICAAAKGMVGKPRRLLQQMAVSSALWKEISIDSIVELPETSGNTVIWISSQNKYILSASPKIPSTQTLANLFLQHIYHLHGIPKIIISDWRVQFTSQFWQEFLKLLGIMQGLNSLHHPQTNGARECTTGVLEQYLRCYVSKIIGQACSHLQ